MKLALKEKIMLVCLAAALAAFGAYKAVWTPLGVQLEQLKIKQAEVKELAVDITPLKKEAKSLEDAIAGLESRAADIKAAQNKTFTSEEFLVFLGKSAKNNNVAVTGFSDLGTVEKNGLYKAVYDFSLKGSGKNIASVLSELSESGVKSSVGSMSLRQNVQYGYLKRFFDDLTGLPWYKEPEKTEEVPELQKETEEPTFVPDTSFDVPDIPAVPELPQNPEPTAEPTPPPEDRTIDERLSGLLENTAYRGRYRAKLLANNGGDDMRLSITVCFVMFKDPAEGSNGIL